MRQMQDAKQDKRDPTLPTNLLSSFGWAYRLAAATHSLDCLHILFLVLELIWSLLRSPGASTQKVCDMSSEI